MDERNEWAERMNGFTERLKNGRTDGRSDRQTGGHAECKFEQAAVVQEKTTVKR